MEPTRNSFFPIACWMLSLAFLVVRSNADTPVSGGIFSDTTWTNYPNRFYRIRSP